MRNRSGRIIGLFVSVLLANLGWADEEKRAVFIPTEGIEKRADIPDEVKKATTYRIVPLHDVVWQTRAEYLKQERLSGQFIGQLMREFREDCEKGETKENPLYALVWEEIAETVTEDKCKTRLPIFFSATATAFPAIGKGKLMTVAHVFKSDVDSFVGALAEVDKMMADAQEAEIASLKKHFESAEAKREIDRIVREAAIKQNFRPTQREYDAIVKKGFDAGLKKIEEKWAETANLSRLVALNHLWNFPLRFWLFDQKGDVVFAPTLDGKRSAVLSYVSTGETLKIHAAQPNAEASPFAATFDSKSQLYFKNPIFSHIIENMTSAIVITVKGVELAPPLELEDEIRSQEGDTVFVRGYPRLTWDRMSRNEPLGDSDGDKEYISVGKIISPGKYYELAGIFNLMKDKPKDKETLLALTGDLIIFTDAATVEGNSGSPILNHRGRVAGIVNSGTKTKKIEDAFVFGPTGYGTLAFLSTYNDMQKFLKSPAVKNFLQKEPVEKK